MSAPLLVLAFAACFVFAWLNANAVGKFWSEAKLIKGSVRTAAVIGYALSVAGFTVMFDYLILRVALSGDKDALRALTTVFDIVEYVIAAFAVLGAVFFIWWCSRKSAFQETASSFCAAAGSKTRAAMRRKVEDSRIAPAALLAIASFAFSGAEDSDSDGAGRLFLFVLLVALLGAVLGGWFVTSAISKKADRNFDAFTAQNAVPAKK